MQTTHKHVCAVTRRDVGVNTWAQRPTVRVFAAKRAHMLVYPRRGMLTSLNSLTCPSSHTLTLNFAHSYSQLDLVAPHFHLMTVFAFLRSTLLLS